MPDFVGAPHVGSAVNVWWQGPNRWLPGVVQGYRTVTHQGAQSATVELSVALEDGTQSWHALHDTQFATYPAAAPTTQALVEHAGHYSDVPTDAPPCAVQFAMPLQLLPAPQPHGELQLPVMSHSMGGYLHPYASMPQMPFMHSTPLAVAPLISPQQLCVAPPSSLPPPPPPPPPAALPPPAGGAEACTPAHAPTPSPPAAATVSLPPPADPAAEAAARGRERERGKEERERGKEERERSKEKRRASDVFGGGNGRAASAPPAERKRERRQAGEAAADEARDEARAQLRGFEAAGWQREPAALRELRQLPDILDVWLRCEVLKHRLPLPPLTLPELERALCGLPPPDDSAEARGSAELMGALHTALLAALQPPPPAADGWEAALAAAMEAGLWSAAHADAPLPLLQPLAAPKHCAWVTERGPSLCGTFGCTLPNNHLGLHQVPEAASRRRARRGDEAEPPAAAPPPRRAVPYAEVPPHARLALLSCLTAALLTPAEARLVERGGGAAYLGSDGEHGYWGVMRHYRLYRCKLPAAAEAEGALPLGGRWAALCADKSDCRRFAAALALFCRAAGADGAAARLLASRLRSFLTADDRRAVDEAVGKAAAEEERRRATHRRAEAAAPPDALASLAGLPLFRADSHGEAEGGGVVVRASLRVCKVPVGHRQLAVRAVLKLSIPRQRRISSTLKWRRQDYAEQAEQHKRAAADGEPPRRRAEAEGGDDGGDEAEGGALEAERVLGHRVGVGGEPRYLVAWKGHGAEYNSWEPWTALAGSAALTARWHGADRAPAAWAAACPAQFESDPELPSWRVVTKRTSSGKVSKVFYGPKGEAVRSRSAALQICALYGKHGR